MQTDAHPAIRSRDRLVCALITFLIVSLVGSGAGFIMMQGFKTRVEDTARRDARLIGETVARSLAAQFEKAARFGIPLKMLPGVEPYLTETLHRTPGLTRIVLQGPDGREVRSAIGPLTGLDTVTLPITIDGVVFGQVAVSTTPATLSSVLGKLSWRAGVVVLTCASLGAVIAAFYAGGSLVRGRRRLATALLESAAGKLRDAPPGGGRGPLATAFRALNSGERRMAERRTAFEGYSEELLAVDFDGRLRAEIEQIRRDAQSRPPSQREP
ncbi:LapA family protein [Aquabacter cavernae]|uniref:LapA family protein n=1 Tax=Aquabacter cavernae TaxID=2496029 RepID=UPI000F8CDDFB|nr:LapA family protein [Aquabacter cavernae]